MDPRELLFNAKLLKAQRDATNPIAEAAASGWKSGVDRELKSREEMKQTGLKYALESAMSDKKQKQDFMKDSWLKYDHFMTEGGKERLATPKESLEAFKMALQGQDYPGMSSRLKKTEYSPYERKTQELQAGIDLGVTTGGEKSGAMSDKDIIAYYENKKNELQGMEPKRTLGVSHGGDPDEYLRMQAELKKWEPAYIAARQRATGKGGGLKKPSPIFNKPAETATPAPAPTPQGKVLVINPRGVKGYIPAEQLAAALEQGYKRGN